jgi:hypothetical protein
MGHASSAVAAGYQHVLAGRDSAIAAALDDLIAVAKREAEGTRRARKTGPSGA